MSHTLDFPILKPIKPQNGLIGKDVSGSIELRFNGRRIGFEVYNSRKERSDIIEQWRQEVGTPYHDNEYFLIIKSDL